MPRAQSRRLAGSEVAGGEGALDLGGHLSSQQLGQEDRPTRQLVGRPAPVDGRQLRDADQHPGPGVELPPLEACSEVFWALPASPALPGLHAAPRAAAVPDAVLRQLAAPEIVVRRRRLDEVLAPGYSTVRATEVVSEAGDTHTTWSPRTE